MTSACQAYFENWWQKKNWYNKFVPASRSRKATLLRLRRNHRTNLQSTPPLFAHKKDVRKSTFF